MEENKDLNVNNSERNSSADMQPDSSGGLHNIIHVHSMFENWFLDYASYVILDRAVPDVMDGLKPVQRRILHSMYELEDGRYNKVANIIGNTMKYHPHGDQSIGDAIVQLGQKELTIDTQGNWGNILTGDRAAASRYIEARLTKFALEVVFNPRTTEWQLSYDRRNKEPIALPIKFPLLLAQGVKGIAVGLQTEIFPHNFIELIDASIAILQNKDFEIYPDFQTGGAIDVSKYNDGLRGGKIRCRAKIAIIDNKTLVINEIPFGTNTISLIESITKKIEEGKLKIKKIDDNTAATAEILLHLQQGVSPDQTIDALYAFTDCEKSYSPNACVIHHRKPVFLSVKDILKINTDNTVALLKKELEIQLADLEEDWHRISLEKLFFEKRFYKELEKDRESWDEQVDFIERAFDPYRDLFRKEITRDDVLRLCDKPVKKISKFDIKKAEDQLANIELNIEEVKNHLEHLIGYAIQYFKQLKKKYGEGRERKTEIKNFDTIVASTVAVANQKLYVDKKEGFVGTGLKKDENVEYVGDCSDMDEIIVFNESGKFIIRKVSDKHFFGKNIVLAEVFKRGDDRTIYNMVYSDGPNGIAMIKRFAIGGVTRDREYCLTKGKDGSKVLYITSNPNGEAEKIKVYLKPKPKLKKTQFEFDFSTLTIKGRSSQGNILTRNAVKKIEMSAKGISTLSAIDVYFDSAVLRLNTDERGELLGAFKEDDKVISVYKSGYYRVTGYDGSIHFEDTPIIIKKFNPNNIISVLYRNKKEKKYFIKRFKVENADKKMEFIAIDKDTELLAVSIDYLPQLEVKYLGKKNETLIEFINVSEYIDIMTIRARGKRISLNDIKEATFITPFPYEEPEIEEETLEIEEDETENGNDFPDEDIDTSIAKEIFETIQPDILPKKEKNNDEEEKGEQLLLF